MSTNCILLQGIPEVQGSKFVFGAIIPGASNKANQEDVFVVVCNASHKLCTRDCSHACCCHQRAHMIVAMFAVVPSMLYVHSS